MGDLKLLLGIVLCIILPSRVLSVPAAVLVKRQQPASIPTTSQTRRPTSTFGQRISSLPTLQAGQSKFTGDSNPGTSFVTDVHPNQGQNVYHSTTTGQQRPFAPAITTAEGKKSKSTTQGKDAPTSQTLVTEAGAFVGQAGTEDQGLTAPLTLVSANKNTIPTDVPTLKTTSAIPDQENTALPDGVETGPPSSSTTGNPAAGSFPVPTAYADLPTSQAAAKPEASSAIEEPVALTTTRQPNMTDHPAAAPAFTTATIVNSTTTVAETETHQEDQNSTTLGEPVTISVPLDNGNTVQGSTNDTTSDDHTSVAPNVTSHIQATEQITPVFSEGDLGNGTTAAMNMVQETIPTTLLPEKSSSVLNQSTAQATTYGKTSGPPQVKLVTTQEEKETLQAVTTATTAVPHHRKRPPVDGGKIVVSTAATTTTTTTKISVPTKPPLPTSIKQGSHSPTTTTSGDTKEDILHQIKNYTNSIVKQYGALKVTLALLAVILLLFLTMFCCCKICKRKGYGIRQRRLKEFGQEKEFLLKDRGGANSKYNNDTLTLLDGSSEDEF